MNMNVLERQMVHRFQRCWEVYQDNIVIIDQAERIFHKVFGDAAQASYMESQDAYTSLFENQNKYNYECIGRCGISGNEKELIFLHEIIQEGE